MCYYYKKYLLVFLNCPVFYIELTHKRCRVSPNMTSRQNNFDLGNIAENKRSPHTRM